MALTQRDDDVRATVLSLVNLARGITAEANLDEDRIRIPSRDVALGERLRAHQHAVKVGPHGAADRPTAQQRFEVVLMDIAAQILERASRSSQRARLTRLKPLVPNRLTAGVG